MTGMFSPTDKGRMGPQMRARLGGGALPDLEDPRSPALSNQPQSVTGINPAVTQQTTAPGTGSPALAPDANAASTGGPLSSGAAPQSQASAGTPDLVRDRSNGTQYLTEDLVDEVGTDNAYKAGQVAAGRAKQQAEYDPEGSQLLLEQLGIGDMEADDLKKTFVTGFRRITAMRADDGSITPSQKKKQDENFTNLFGGMSKQELGLFLFQYGSIMMANGDQGLGAAAGMAGMGAFGSLQERRRYAEEQRQGALERTRKAALEERGMVVDEGTLGVARSRAEADLETARNKAPDTIETDQGIFQYNPETKQFDIQIKGPDGKPVMPKSSIPTTGVKAWEIEQWQKAYPGMTEEEATYLALSGVKPAQAELEAKAAFSREKGTGDVFIPGKGSVRKRDLTDEDRDLFIRDWVISNYGRPGTLSGGGGGGGAPDRSALEKEYPRPDGMSDDEYNEYLDIQRQLKGP